MRHQNGLKKLSRNGSHRRAMLRNMVTALFRHERIETTEAKAKVLRGYAERLVTLGKRGDLHARRLAARQIKDGEILRKLFGDIAVRTQGRPGGYTRVLKMGHRRGDGARVALIELVDREAATEATDVATASKGDGAVAQDA